MTGGELRWLAIYAKTLLKQDLSVIRDTMHRIPVKARQRLTTRHTYAWTSKTVYNRLPLYAGFFVAPEGRGAKVVAALLANLETWRLDRCQLCMDDSHPLR